MQLNQIDHTHNRGTKFIDSNVATPNLRKHIEGSRLFETNEISSTDH